MMHFRGFKSKAALKQAVKDAAHALRPRIPFERYAEETSLFGAEFKPGTVAKYCVCMDHPKRTKFANISVDAEGFITAVA